MAPPMRNANVSTSVMGRAIFFLGRASKRFLAFACSAALMLWYVHPAYAMGKRAAAKTPSAAGAGQEQPAGTQKVVASTEDFRYNAKGKRDPFFPLVTPDGRLTAPASTKKAVVMLEGVIWDPDGDSAAMINGTVVEPGDEVEGYRIVTIVKDGVVLERDGKLMKVRLAIGELDEGGGEPVESTP